MKSKSRKACAYCDGCGPFTREHVFGFFFENHSGKRHRHTSAKTGYRSVSGAPTIRDVCRDCNNRRLSPLDAYGASLLKRFFSRTGEDLAGRSFHVSRNKLLRWLLKLSYNGARPANEQISAHRSCRQFILGDSRHPPFTIDLLVQLMPSASPAPGARVSNFLRIGELLLPEVEEHLDLRRLVAVNRFFFAIVGWKRGAPHELRAAVRRSLQVAHGFQLIRRSPPLRLKLGPVTREQWEASVTGEAYLVRPNR